MTSHKPTERVVNILTLISKNEYELTMTKISQSLNIPKSTLTPILKTLVDLELLILDPIKQTYAIGLTAFKIGESYVHNINGMDIIKSHMRTIVNSCNETCQLGINHKNEVLYLTKIEGSNPIKLLSSIGRNLPLYCTGLGRALLCAYSEEEIRDLYSENMIKFTEYTNTDIDNLLMMIKAAKENGYAYEKREITTDAACIAVPLIINDKVQAALGISLPFFTVDEEKRKQIIDLLITHSKLITKEFSDYNIKSII